MKYTREVTIDLPRDRVIELFDDADNLTKWQEGLQAFEHVSGEPGQPGAKSRLVYDHRGRRFELIETITERNLPDEFSGIYETDGVWNLMTNRFEEEGPDRTRWIAESEFRPQGIKMKLMAIVLRPLFTARTTEDPERFQGICRRRGSRGLALNGRALACTLGSGRLIVFRLGVGKLAARPACGPSRRTYSRRMGMETLREIHP